MAFTCPRCGMTSQHPTDEAEGYCGNCHDWTSKRLAWEALVSDAIAIIEHYGAGQPSAMLAAQQLREQRNRLAGRTKA